MRLAELCGSRHLRSRNNPYILMLLRHRIAGPQQSVTAAVPGLRQAPPCEHGAAGTGGPPGAPAPHGGRAHPRPAPPQPQPRSGPEARSAPGSSPRTGTRPPGGPAAPPLRPPTPASLPAPRTAAAAAPPPPPGAHRGPGGHPAHTPGGAGGPSPACPARPAPLPLWRRPRSAALSPGRRAGAAARRPRELRPPRELRELRPPRRLLPPPPLLGLRRRSGPPPVAAPASSPGQQQAPPPRRFRRAQKGSPRPAGSRGWSEMGRDEGPRLLLPLPWAVRRETAKGNPPPPAESG
ncbi:basic proline-rich protein-like [Ammospiza caudacuta]|uniref:basic proline-rich protein-like n=1 Tax=Ammospiza caudacuta TaxID=2857398 RepID=UPI002739F6B7|nr:basic proline-rich protein-like [Ammospiza caudacuta]